MSFITQSIIGSNLKKKIPKIQSVASHLLPTEGNLWTSSA